MRLWSLHPKHLDTKGLVALWREALLARAVLLNQTRGYKNHPQLQRFRAHPSPIDAIQTYLRAVHEQAALRGYNFDAGKLAEPCQPEKIAVTEGQIAHEWKHLLQKLIQRTPDYYQKQVKIKTPEAHPLFIIKAGPVAPWEKSARL